MSYNELHKVVVEGDRHMRIILCEDNPDYRARNLKIVETFLEREDLKAEISSFGTYQETLAYIRSLDHYDDCLYILDIGLGGEKNGLVLGREIRELDNYQGELIFVTGYSHQMGNVIKYKLRILDFIDKGMNLEKELEEDLKIFLKLYREKTDNGYLAYKVDGDIKQISFRDILWIDTEKSQKKILVHTSREVFSIGLSLKEAIKKLPDSFKTIHRCTLINRNHAISLVNSENGLFVRMIDGSLLSVAKRSEKDVRKWFI
jgi:two-component system response regulator AgrA